MTTASKVIEFATSLKVSEGPKAGKPIKMAPFQKQYIRGAYGKGTLIACLSMARGNGKSMLSSVIALGELIGEWDQQPRREIIVAARTQAQAQIIWNFVAGLAQGLDPDLYERLTFRRGQRLEIAFDDEHVIRCISAQPQNALGTSPTLCIMDERAHW
ncbi:MAG: terminase large subunit, partial [Pirellulales bacterium]